MKTTPRNDSVGGIPFDRTVDARAQLLSTGGAATLPRAGASPRRALLMLEDLGGGTGNHVCQMVSRWVAAGWQVTIVTQAPPLVQHLPAGVDVRVIPRAGWYDRFPLAQARRLHHLRRLVRELRPDVVHTYFFWSIVYGRMLKRLGFGGALVENREDTGFSWGWVVYGILRLTREIPDRIICVAEAVRQAALAREKVRAEAAVVVHNGVQPESVLAMDRREARRRFGFTDEHVVVGMVANLPRAVKGGRRLLEAIAPIVAAAPNVRFLLLGVGTEATTLDPELKARGIENVVVGAGYRRDVDACYAAMDISVLTSSTEGLSITILESMRHALPTVCTSVGGNPEAVVDGVTGYLVPVDEPAVFVERVVELASDPALRAAMGAAARRRVAERFAIDGVAERYLAAYDALLSDRRHRATSHVIPLRRRPIT